MSFLTRTGKMSYAGGKIKAGKGNHSVSKTICLQIPRKGRSQTTLESGTNNNNN